MDAALKGSAGRQVAKLSLGLVGLITLIPAFVVLLGPKDSVVFVALGAGVLASLYAAFCLHVSRAVAPRWLPPLNNLF